MIYFAHRGYNVKYPENTLLAFDKAISAGCTAVELDVHKTKDGKLVVIHDENVKRTYNGNVLIKDATLSQLKLLNPKNPEFEESKLCRIPTLSEVLELLKPYDITINIEIKTDQIHYDNIEEDVINLIKQLEIEDKIIISSFNHKSLEICKKIDPTLKLGVLFHTKMDNIIEYANELGAYSIHPNVKLVTASLVNAAHNNNLKVYTYTVNSNIIEDELRKIGCDGIFTDDIKKWV